MHMTIACQGSAVQKKAIELFESRKLWNWLLIRGASRSMIASISPHLLAVQESIYRLDQYGESHWSIKDSKINGLWSDIFDAISDGDAKSLVQPHVVRSLEELKAYQNIELALRFGVDPLAIPISNFYYLKSCDLRLCRTLAAKHLGPVAQSVAELRLWRLLDVSGEIRDDLEDLEEDVSTLNCNRFMISLIKRGVSYTDREYREFLQRCSSSLCEIMQNIERVDEPTVVISCLTKEAIAEAQCALRALITDISDDRLLSPSQQKIVTRENVWCRLC